MIPKKAKDFRKEVADEMNLSEDLVNNVIEFYWDTIRKKLSTLAHPAIEIVNFGTFKVKHWGIEEEIKKFNAIIKAKEGKFQGYHIKVELEERIAAMERIKAEILEEKEKFKEIRKNKYAKNKNNLEEQEPDMGGSDKQDL